MTNYSLTEKADSDLIEIYRYGIRQHGQRLADQYYDALIERFETIAEDPDRYQIDDDHPNYHTTVCGWIRFTTELRKAAMLKSSGFCGGKIAEPRCGSRGTTLEKVLIT